MRWSCVPSKKLTSEPVTEPVVVPDSAAVPTVEKKAMCIDCGSSCKPSEKRSPCCTSSKCCIPSRCCVPVASPVEVASPKSKCLPGRFCKPAAVPVAVPAVVPAVVPAAVPAPLVIRSTSENEKLSTSTDVSIPDVTPVDEAATSPQ